jgi:cyclopropane-fatty-acyl-phospholipid synthase
MDGDARRPCIHGFVASKVAGVVLPKVDARVVLDDGTVLGAGGPTSPQINVADADAFFRRVGHEPKIGFGDAYVEGDWRPGDGTDLAVALYPFARVIDDAVPMWTQRISALAEQRIPRSMRNTLEGSKKNIEAHYDLSNDLFAQFLDPSLTYSSALFDDAKPWESQTLQEAQERKVDAALDRARVTRGTRVLEIGTGWGTLAIRAAQRGATVTTVTLSVEQAALATARAKAAGVADRIDIRVEDYREVTGEYDAVLSIEMIEAVGEEYWPTYFDAIDRRLAPGGTAVVQAILMSHERYRVTRKALSWIQKHIFPGGIIPSVRAIEQAVASTSLRITEQAHFGRHYAETLRRWRATFLEHWPVIEALGFEPRFRRIWEFYLAYSEAGFETEYLDVAQFRFEREVAA